ncbi:MAG: WbqC family protein [Nitrospirae bacterium]|nr:WbqC family protein [Nitrospirota bacterium]
MRIAILQPGYLPWLGFFEQMYRSDVFVIYDDVQYDKEGWRNRNRIKTADGVQWLTVPVYVKFEESPLITEIKIDNKANWRKKHFFSIRQNYSKAPFYKKYINIFEDAYSREWEYLVDIDMHFILKLAGCLGMGDKKIVRSSALNVTGDRIERLIKMCKFFKADTFYEGSAGRNYMDVAYFAENGIRIEFQDYKHPVYEQLHGDFVPYLSVIDLLLNNGEESLSILINERQGQGKIEETVIR